MDRPCENELKKYKVLIKSDNAFTSNARLWQSKWREENKIPIGMYRGIEIGSLINYDYAFAHMANFISEHTKDFIRMELPRLETTPVFDTNRFLTNLLSSQPLCFNLFCELKKQLNIATIIFQKLLQNVDINEIIKIDYEYSPGRGNIKFTKDNTAFDVFIEYFQSNGKKCFLGIEVKYTETLNEDKQEKIIKYDKERYKELTIKSGMFKNISTENFKKPQLWQIWRDHLLSISMLKESEVLYEYERGYFIYLYPSQNTQCNEGIKMYKKYLKDNHNVLEIHLENIIKEIKNKIDEEWVSNLSKRYIGE